MQEGDEQVLADARRIGQFSDTDAASTIADPQELARRLLTSVYMGTVNSSRATRERAKLLANQIGTDHLDVNIDGVVDAMSFLFGSVTGHKPRFQVSCSAHSCHCPGCIVLVWSRDKQPSAFRPFPISSPCQDSC